MRLDVHGVSASPGRAEGVLVLAHELPAHGLPDAILLSERLTPSDFPHLLRCVGALIITGGMTSHGAILCRELGIPAVSGVHRKGWRQWRNAPAVVDGFLGIATIHVESVDDEGEGHARRSGS